MSIDDISKLSETALDYLMEGFQLISPEWKYLYVNSALVLQSKYNSKSDLLGFTMMEKFPGIEKTPMFKQFEKCMNERIAINFENEFNFPDGTKGWFELKMHPVPLGVYILSQDITEKKRAEASKAAYINSLEEMIHMASHKVRKPVCNILGVSEVLEDSKISHEELKKLAGYMKTSVESLDHFTKELTSFIEIKINNQK